MYGHSHYSEIDVPVTYRFDDSAPLGFDFATLTTDSSGPTFVHEIRNIKFGAQAHSYGIKEGRQIIAVNGVDIRNLGHNKATEFIRRAEQPLKITVVFQHGQDGPRVQQKAPVLSMGLSNTKVVTFKDRKLGFSIVSQSSAEGLHGYMHVVSCSGVPDLTKGQRICAINDVDPTVMSPTEIVEYILAAPRPISITVVTDKGADKCVQCGQWKRCAKCGGCNRVQYCGKECQRAHWRGGHQLKCTRGVLATVHQGSAR